MPDPSVDDPLAPNAHTVLRLSGIGVPPYSCRGAQQSLDPIDQAKANIRRTINGKMKDNTLDMMRLYKTTISCKDQFPPNIDGKWPGRTVVVDCISTLSYDVGGTPSRPVVPGSEVVEGAHVKYRPRLTMVVMDFSTNEDEYPADIAWSMDLEEKEPST